MGGTSRDWLNTQHARVDGRNFAGADLTSVHPVATWFDRCDFSGADLRLATFDQCIFRFCDFTRATLEGASLRGARFAGCDFTDADLRNSDLTDAEFTLVNTGKQNGLTDVTGALFAGAQLAGLVMDRVAGWIED